MGVTDIPCCEAGDDLLNMKKYVTGLEKFIEACPTPMSIAIQGDWGTGKTSTINMLKAELEKEEHHIKCVYFNTWQYSQFNMVDDLYISFVNALVSKCFAWSKKKEDILKIVYKMGTGFLSYALKENTGMKIEDVFEKQETSYEKSSLN